MKKRLSLKIAILFMLALMLTSAPASAEVGMAGDLGIGGHVILGGTAGNGFGGFTFGLTPHISIFPIDNLAVFARLPFWEGNFAGGDVHVFPFMFGVRYYFNVLDNLRVYPGIAIGASVLHYPGVNFGFGFGNVVAPHCILKLCHRWCNLFLSLLDCWEFRHQIAIVAGGL